MKKQGMPQTCYKNLYAKAVVFPSWEGPANLMKNFTDITVTVTASVKSGFQAQPRLNTAAT